MFHIMSIINELKGSSMNNVPSWPNLKHFASITTMDFSDSQSYLDALKVSYAFVNKIIYLT